MAGIGNMGYLNNPPLSGTGIFGSLLASIPIVVLPLGIADELQYASDNLATADLNSELIYSGTKTCANWMARLQ